MTDEQQRLLKYRLAATASVLDASTGTREQQLEAIVRSLATHLLCIVELDDVVPTSSALAKAALEFVDSKPDYVPLDMPWMGER